MSSGEERSQEVIFAITPTKDFSPLISMPESLDKTNDEPQALFMRPETE